MIIKLVIFTIKPIEKVVKSIFQTRSRTKAEDGMT